MSRRLWLAFCAVDAVVFVTVCGYFHHLYSVGLYSVEVVRAVLPVLPVLVVVRTAILLAVVMVVTRTRPPERIDRSPSPVALA